MVEVPMSHVVAKLKLADTAQIVVLDVDGQQVPYQVTYDEKVVFPATVESERNGVYTIQPGTPAPFDVVACGRYYPERLDDVAWENDLGGFSCVWSCLASLVENVVLAMIFLRSTIQRNQFWNLVCGRTES